MYILFISQLKTLWNLKIYIVRKVLECQTVDEVVAMENLFVLNEYEQCLVCERKIEIIMSEQELMPNLMDSWNPE